MLKKSRYYRKHQQQRSQPQTSKHNPLSHPSQRLCHNMSLKLNNTDFLQTAVLDLYLGLRRHQTQGGSQTIQGSEAKC